LYELQYTLFMVNGPALWQTVSMVKPTYRDATLLVQLAQWQTVCDLDGALRWLASDRFSPDFADFTRLYPPGSEEDRKASLICAYFETVGALYDHGLINEELLFDWLEVAPVWDRIKGYALGQREGAQGSPPWLHFEALAIAHKRQTRAYST
jgi:hypothetical protein